MILNQDSSDAKFQIRAYELGRITVNETVYQHSLIISAEHLISDWRPQSLQELKPEHWQAALALKPEVILLGTGERFQMPAQHLLAPVYQQKLGVEIMDTRAACRTYMALIAEGRKVLAALLIN